MAGRGPAARGLGRVPRDTRPRDGTLYAATNHRVYGSTVQRSADGGKTWTRSQNIGLPEESGLTLNAVWHIEPGRPEEPDTLYLGAAPGVLFRSDDGGNSWEVNRGILDHPTRERWFPGAGGMCCHSIQLDPREPRRMYVGITSAGVFRSEDGGENWLPINNDVKAEFLGDPHAEVGQCPHKVLLHPARPDRLWQQNHYGVYVSDDHGDSWARLDGNGLPSGFGFPLMLDPNDPAQAFVIPEKSPEYHYSSAWPACRIPHARQRRNVGADGRRPAEAGVGGRAPRGLGLDSESLYFGTQSGSFFALTEGELWMEAVRHLPPILSVEVTPWSG